VPIGGQKLLDFRPHVLYTFQLIIQEANDADVSLE
jgi:hypothetical protein